MGIFGKLRTVTKMYGVRLRQRKLDPAPVVILGLIDADARIRPPMERTCIGVIARRVTATGSTAQVLVADLPGLLQVDATVLNQCYATWYVEIDPTSTAGIGDDVTIIGGDGTQDYSKNWDNPSQPGGGGQIGGVTMGLTQQCTQLEFAMRTAVGGSHRMNVLIHIWKIETPICDHAVIP